MDPDYLDLKNNKVFFFQLKHKNKLLWIIWFTVCVTIVVTATVAFITSTSRWLTLSLSHSIWTSWIDTNIFIDCVFNHCNKTKREFYSHTDAREPYLVISASALPSVCESPKFKYCDCVCPVRLSLDDLKNFEWSTLNDPNIVNGNTKFHHIFTLLV